MTKADLVEEVTQLGDLTRRDGEMIVDTIFDSVIHALRSGDKIEIRGFGSRVRNCATWLTPGTGRRNRMKPSLEQATGKDTRLPRNQPGRRQLRSSSVR
jgi:nucleoid DNA-binding protein